MFGCCVAGRPLQTNIQTIDDTHAIFELPHASSVNHVCVFLLGNVPFPDGYGATVHFFWPGKGFQLLGMLSNEKPSAIFRLRGTFSSTTSHSISSAMSSPSPSPAPENPMGADVVAVLGIAIEPLDAIQAQMATLNSTLSKPPPAMEPTLIAEKVVKNLFNFVTGFANGMITPETPVPFGIIMRWYDQFLGKVRAGGIGFLEREA
ncbi:hypothetical protein EV122DRAFT_266228 [Schizophyllum commune]|uniref:Uncharacterized protein n=1 Tax=Schizophyllum commune (strain H4-8 / FGSC 9210) TaxID=578458 RepID=D8Q7Z8_SCHCM|nr:DUF775-domain-containing protein [Schizophyllum commune H4-8]KAI4521535.1 DUF775-domain-containing protein [Schizophyllum commune Loenen D]KAI5831896.1 DUF775-domain-containing protein [Schizophyllum commune Tattone D]KAI5891273.1 DUF775-domain-containing protein [Schizophyllum commune H4-8]